MEHAQQMKKIRPHLHPCWRHLLVVNILYVKFWLKIAHLLGRKDLQKYLAANSITLFSIICPSLYLLFVQGNFHTFTSYSAFPEVSNKCPVGISYRSLLKVSKWPDKYRKCSTGVKNIFCRSIFSLGSIVYISPLSSFINFTFRCKIRFVSWGKPVECNCQ